MNYGQNIKRLREKHGMSQCELAKAMGISAVMVCGWERGNKKISLENLVVLADVLLTTTDEILGRKR